MNHTLNSLLGAAESMIAARRFEDARQLSIDALAAEPDAAEPHLMLARIFLAEDEFDQAMNSAKLAIKADPDVATAYVVAAQCVLCDNERITGLGLSDPHSPRAAVRRGEEAERWLDHALLIDSENPDAIGTLAWAQVSQGENRLAAKTARRGLAIDPEHPLCLDVLQTAMDNLGKGKAAEAVARTRLELDVESPHAHAQLATQLLERGEIEAARVHAVEALRLDPADRALEQLYWSTAQPEGRLGEVIIRLHGFLLQRQAPIRRLLRRNPRTATVIWVVMFAVPAYLAALASMRLPRWVAAPVWAVVLVWLGVLCGASVTRLMLHVFLLSNPVRRASIFRSGWWVTPLVTVAAMLPALALLIARLIDNPWLILTPFTVCVTFLPALIGLWLGGAVRACQFLVSVVAWGLAIASIRYWILGHREAAQQFCVYAMGTAIVGSMGVSYLFAYIRDWQEDRADPTAKGRR